MTKVTKTANQMIAELKVEDSAPYEAPEPVEAPSPPWTGPKWEYVYKRTGGGLVAACNEMGEEGWEFVESESGYTMFKRQKIG